MLRGSFAMIRFTRLLTAAGIIFACPAAAQVTSIDPNQADQYAAPADASAETAPPAEDPYAADALPPADDAAAPSGDADAAPVTTTTAATSKSDVPPGTVSNSEVLRAAESVFGKGAAGLAGMIENILRDQGEPSGYIKGEEAGAAVGFGARYGSGTLTHNVEGDRRVFWRGPSIGFDAGIDADRVFILVYNLHDSEQLFRPYASAEGKAYIAGGLTAAYLRRGDVVLIPIRMGVGVRLGVNAGYTRFSKKKSILPL